VIALSGCREGRKIGRDLAEIDQLRFASDHQMEFENHFADTAARLTRTAVTLALGGRPGRSISSCRRIPPG
jgi:hypothetical protein